MNNESDLSFSPKSPENRQNGQIDALASHHCNRELILVEQQKMLSETIARIRQSWDLATIFATTTTEVRQLLKADRVAVFRFINETQGEFIAEDVKAEEPSILNNKISLCCFGTKILEWYKQGKICANADVERESLESLYIQFLRRLQVKSNVVVPLLKNEKLWGLLSIHQCSQSRQWQSFEIEFVRQIANHFSIALQQADYIEKARNAAAQLAQASEREKSAQRQKTVFKIIEKVRQSLNIETIFATATQEIRYLLETDRSAIYRFLPDWSGQFVAESVGDEWPSLLEEYPIVEDTYLQLTQGGRYALGESFFVNDIYQAGHQDCHLQLLEQFAAKAYAIAPIFKGEKLWGLFAIYQNQTTRQWQADDISLLSQIGAQLGIAIQQAEYFKQVQEQAAQLAIAAEQERSLERQRTLAATIDKIRKSLDIETIFTTTTKETRQLLNVERVAIYRFLPDWSGEIVAESIVTGWTSLLQKQPFIADTYLQETEGGRYRNNEYSVIDDIYKAGYSDCHIALLKDLEVRAYIIVPIFQGQTLWGLLAAYQNSEIRHWEAYEVDFLAQIGSQLGIALQQAELLKQTRQQAQAIAQTLQELRQAQTQLIQNEKMAGLGQLVAGVAHEINNPINFVYGNLSYVEDYTKDLLELINLYRDCYPHPATPIRDRAETIDLDFITTDLPKILVSMKMGTERIRQLVLSLRTFSRIDEAQMKRVNIHDGIDSTLLILQHRLKTKAERTDIKIVREYGDLPLVECYAAQLNQVFMNILSNSIDALDDIVEKPTLWIRTDVKAETVAISIKDNGPGIAEPIKERIFDPFFTTKPIGKGTGLGLSISHQIIVEKHKGWLECHSQLGTGTEFKIEIPIRQR
jgi:GAF domain-containing protein